MNTSRSFPWPLLSGAAVAGAVFLGIAYNVSSKNAPESPQQVAPPTLNSKIVVPPDAPEATNPAKQDDPEETVRIVERDHKQRPTLSSTVKVRKGQDRVTSAVSQSVKSAGYGDINILGVETSGGVATVDINSAAIDSLGTSGEADFVDVIKKSLSQFKNVKSFKLRVDGKVMDSLGHGDLTGGTPIR